MNLGAQRLVELPVFKNVPEPDLAALARFLLFAELPAGTVLYREGEPAKDAAIILAGRLAVSVGEGRAVGDVWPGDVIGEAGLFGPAGARSATVTAVMPTRLAVLTMDAVAALPENRALMALEQKLLNHMAKRIRSANARLATAEHTSSAVSPPAGASRPRPPEAPEGILASLRRIFGGVS